MWSHRALAAPLAVAAAACGSATREPPADRTLDLRAALDVADAAPAGVAVDPDGRRFVLDEARGLYEIKGGRLELALTLADLPADVPVRPPFTDLVALAPGRFAITAIGDGYLLDLELRTLRQYFCYEPEEMPPSYDQRTDGVTYDPTAGLIHAQPRTFEGETLVASQVASYAFQTGVDVAWVTVDDQIAAGGMAMLPGIDGPILGVGSRLLHVGADGTGALDDLERLGIGAIAGLATDADAGTLLVLDGAHDRLVELDLADLAR